MFGKKLTQVVLLTAILATPALAQDNDAFLWRKALAAGKAIEIKGINGDIRVTAATGSEVIVRATKSAKRSDESSVEVVVVEHAGGATICAVYPAPRGKPDNECLPGARGRSNSENNDTEVDFEVQIPRGVLFTGRTVNGSVRATGVTADVNASTVNGGVRVETTGLARATTVNGSIDVSMGRANWTETLEFSTVNGGITLQMPGEIDTEVSASTVNGSLSSEWPLTIKGRWGPRNMNGTIGRGGRELSLATVNGDIELRKN